jgi:hypothetical protein
MSSFIDYTEIRNEGIRTKICELLSEMLDNPDKHGLYQTSRFMWEMENYCLWLVKKCGASVRRRKRGVMSDVLDDMLDAAIEQEKQDELKQLRADLAAVKAERDEYHSELKGISGALVDAGDVVLPAGIVGMESSVRELVKQRDALQARIDGAVMMWGVYLKSDYTPKIHRTEAGASADVVAAKACGFDGAFDVPVLVLREDEREE